MNKYRAIRTTIDGIDFDSKKEANRYWELKMLQKAKKISNLELQPEFPIEHNFKLICKYVADFKYVENGKVVVEDVKGFKTPLYNIKKRLVRAFYDIEIKET